MNGYSFLSYLSLFSNDCIVRDTCLIKYILFIYFYGERKERRKRGRETLI